MNPPQIPAQQLPLTQTPHCLPNADTPLCCSLRKAHTNPCIACEQSPLQPHTTPPLLCHARGRSSAKDKKKEKVTYWQRWEPARALQGRPQLVDPACCILGSTGKSPVPLTQLPSLAGEKVNSSEPNGFAYPSKCPQTVI